MRLCLLRTIAQTVYSLGVPVGKSPGLSTICWQHSDDAAFKVQAGSLEFAGLSGTQKTQCFVGRSCRFGPVPGYSLSSADSVVAIPSSEHCSQGVGPISTAAVSSRPPWAGPWMVSLEDGSAVVDWEPGTIYSGTWKLCYCVHTDLGCTSAASYTIEMGLLTVVGPFSLGEQNFSCATKSVTCSIGPLSGQGLSRADLILLVPAGETCGNLSAALPDSIGMSDLTGLVLEAASPIAGSEETLTFALDNASARTQSPGSWVVCYCVAAGNQSSGCSDDSAFSAQVGHLVVIGPEPMTYHCTLGLPCHVMLTGHGLHVSNAIMVIDSRNTCGSALALPLLEHEGVSWPQRARGRAGQFNAGIPTSGPVGAVGRLCWAVGWSHWEDFTVDVGAFEMLGPQQSRNFTCTFGIPCSLPVLGHGLSPSSEVWIIGGERLVTATWEAAALDRSCAVATQSDAAEIDGFLSPVPTMPQQVSDSQADYNPGVARAGQVGPFFRVCWRHSQEATFAVEVGRFALQGPLATSGFCVKGYPCNVTLGGFGLSPKNTLRIMDENCTNGTHVLIENATGDINSDTSDGPGLYADATGLLGTTEPLRPRDGTDNIYDLGTITRGVPGTHLFLCWSGELAGELTPIGSVRLAGPHDNQDWDEFMSSDCKQFMAVLICSECLSCIFCNAFK